MIASGQGGLLGVCIDPQFATNRMVYWVFSEPVSGGGLTAVAKGRLSNNESTIEAPTVIYRSNTAFSGTSHYGGRIIFDQTGNLFVSMEEGSSTATRPLAQSATASIGKVLWITTDGQPAPGNPSFTGTGALQELYIPSVTEIHKDWPFKPQQVMFGRANTALGVAMKLTVYNPVSTLAGLLLLMVSNMAVRPLVLVSCNKTECSNLPIIGIR